MDGALDLAVLLPIDAAISIFLGNGDGTFQAPQTLNTGSTPLAVAIGDLNGNGLLDLAVGNGRNSDDVSILLNQ